MSKNKIIKKSNSFLLVFYGIILLSCFIFLPSIGMSSDNNAIKKNETDSTFVFENIAKDVPDELAKQISLYWKYKGTSQIKSAYEIEAPHTKYQIPFEKYALYHTKARRQLKGCTVLNVDNISGRATVRIKLILDEQSSYNTQVINDIWINLNSKWYHVYVNFFANIR